MLSSEAPAFSVLRLNGGRAGAPVAPSINDCPLHARSQDDPEAGFAGDHLLEGVGGFLQGVALDHGAHSGERAELHGVFGILGGTGGPSLNRFAAHDQLNGRDRDGLRAGTYDDELAVVRKSVYDCGHGLGIGSSGEDYAGAAEFLKFLGGISGRRIHEMSGAEFSGERFFVFTSPDGEGAKAHLAGILNAEMAETSDALNGDEIAGAGARISQGIEDRDSRAEQRRSLRGGEFVRDGGDGFRGNNDVCLLYTSPSPRDRTRSRMPSSA